MERWGGICPELLQARCLSDSIRCPSATGISWDTDVATKASITEQPRRRKHRAERGTEPCSHPWPPAHIFIYIIYMYVFVYDFFIINTEPRGAQALVVASLLVCSHVGVRMEGMDWDSIQETQCL